MHRLCCSGGDEEEDISAENIRCRRLKCARAATNARFAAAASRGCPLCFITKTTTMDEGRIRSSVRCVPRASGTGVTCADTWAASTRWRRTSRVWFATRSIRTSIILKSIWTLHIEICWCSFFAACLWTVALDCKRALMLKTIDFNGFCEA